MTKTVKRPLFLPLYKSRTYENRPKSSKVCRNWRKKLECREIEPVYPEYSGLTVREMRFVRLLPFCKSKTEAAEKAGCPPGSASAIASRMLKKVKVLEAINRNIAEILGNDREILKNQVINQEKAIAFGDITKFFTKSGEIDFSLGDTSILSSVKIKEVHTKEGETIFTRELKGWNKNNALDHLGRYLKLYEETENKKSATLIINSKNAVINLPPIKTEKQIEIEVNPH